MIALRKLYRTRSVFADQRMMIRVRINIGRVFTFFRFFEKFELFEYPDSKVGRIPITDQLRLRLEERPEFSICTKERTGKQFDFMISVS